VENLTFQTLLILIEGGDKIKTGVLIEGGDKIKTGVQVSKIMT
jgi:hypothetical protein